MIIAHHSNNAEQMQLRSRFGFPTQALDQTLEERRLCHRASYRRRGTHDLEHAVVDKRFVSVLGHYLLSKRAQAHGSRIPSNDTPVAFVKHASNRSIELFSRSVSSTRAVSSWSLLGESELSGNLPWRVGKDRRSPDQYSFHCRDLLKNGLGEQQRSRSHPNPDLPSNTHPTADSSTIPAHPTATLASSLPFLRSPSHKGLEEQTP
jgi:hypothetical protein